MLELKFPNLPIFSNQPSSIAERNGTIGKNSSSWKKVLPKKVFLFEESGNRRDGAAHQAKKKEGNLKTSTPADFNFDLTINLVLAKKGMTPGPWPASALYNQPASLYALSNLTQMGSKGLCKIATASEAQFSCKTLIFNVLNKMKRAT